MNLFDLKIGSIIKRWFQSLYGEEQESPPFVVDIWGMENYEACPFHHNNVREFEKFFDKIFKYTLTDETCNELRLPKGSSLTFPVVPNNVFRMALYRFTGFNYLSGGEESDNIVVQYATFIDGHHYSIYQRFEISVSDDVIDVSVKPPFGIIRFDGTLQRYIQMNSSDLFKFHKLCSSQYLTTSAIKID